MTGLPSSDVKDALRAALRQLLLDRSFTQTALARVMTEEAEKEGLTRRDRVVRYDAAMISRWLDGSSVLSRQAAWLLDLLEPPAPSREGFQDLRDRYVLESDREQAPAAGGGRGLRPLLDTARCSAHVLATSLQRSHLKLKDDERLAWFFLSVVDSTEARQLVDEVLKRFDSVRIVGLYDLLGHWDLVVKAAMHEDVDPSEVETTLVGELIANGMTLGAGGSVSMSDSRGHRRAVADRNAIISADGSSEPEFLVLGSDSEYDLYRVQRAFVFIDLAHVPVLRRAIAQRQLEDLIRDSYQIPCFGIIEAVIKSDDCLILELLMACGHEPGRLNQLNRRIAPELTRFKAPKYVLLVSSCDERGWSSIASTTSQ